MAIELGQKAKDCVTGFSGIVTARVEYLTGCTQYGVSPGLDKDGKVMDTQYFDENRLTALSVGNLVEMRNGTAVNSPPGGKGGPNRDAPRG